MSQKPPSDIEEEEKGEEKESAISHARAYTAPGVTVYYDRGRYLHFAECLRGLPQVFDVANRPWIQPENASAGRVAEVVRRCPSGGAALPAGVKIARGARAAHPYRVCGQRTDKPAWRSEH